MKRVIGAVIVCLVTLFCFSCAKEQTLDIPTDIDVGTVDVRVAVGGDKPQARDFLTSDLREWCDTSGVSVAFEHAVDFTATGVQSVSLLLERDGRTCRLTADALVMTDRSAPEFAGGGELSVLVGEGLPLRAGVTVTDDCFGEIEWTVDASGVDTSREGVYSATYRATDASGNTTEMTVYVYVWAGEITQRMLWDKIDPLLATLYPEQATIEEKCRAIHAYVQGAISYFPMTDKTDPVRAAYNALFGQGRGDCYAYFASAMMLLQRAGIQYLEIERTHEPGEQTHFWLMVNVAPKDEAAQWYHFDPTVVEGGGAAGRGCLFTDAQLDDYNQKDPGFYVYYRENYPSTPERVITE